MERLTHIIKGVGAVPSKLDLEFALNTTQEDWNRLHDIINRLAAYEDTSLTPEEITAALAELSAMKQQIADGKLIEVKEAQNEKH